MPTHATIARIFYTQKSVARTIEVVQEVFNIAITETDIVTAIRSQMAREFSNWSEIPWDYRPGLGRRVRHVS